MDAQAVLVAAQEWQPFAMMAISLGVKSFGVIKAAMEDAGADDAVIVALEPQWAALLADVRRASEA